MRVRKVTRTEWTYVFVAVFLTAYVALASGPFWRVVEGIGEAVMSMLLPS